MIEPAEEFEGGRSGDGGDRRMAVGVERGFTDVDAKMTTKHSVDTCTTSETWMVRLNSNLVGRGRSTKKLSLDNRGLGRVGGWCGLGRGRESYKTTAWGGRED